jgi:hypothetical protein
MPVRVLTLTETVAGVTYTATTSVPKGARILDVLTETTVAWTAATAPVDVGDGDGADSLIAAADLAAQQGAAATGLGGTDWGNGLTDADGPQSAGGPGKLYPNGGTIVAVCTPTVPGGPTGVSRITLLFEFAGATRAAVVV